MFSQLGEMGIFMRLPWKIETHLMFERINH